MAKRIWKHTHRSSKKMKVLEQENIRLKKIVAELTIDNSILKEASRGNY
ncbi:MAG: hypothetical protein HYS24_09875 [Ignavibacteriales bacterium]|nr:hypothetical protein [Ignavibacteriales bacterium]